MITPGTRLCLFQLTSVGGAGGGYQIWGEVSKHPRPALNLPCPLEEAKRR